MRSVRNMDARLGQWKRSQRQARSFLGLYEDKLSIKNRNVLAAYLRCGTSRSRIVRIFTLIRYGFLRTGMLQKLATLVDQWRMKVDGPENGHFRDHPPSSSTDRPAWPTSAACLCAKSHSESK